jgi:hypothetical protein
LSRVGEGEFELDWSEFAEGALAAAAVVADSIQFLSRAMRSLTRTVLSTDASQSTSLIRFAARAQNHGFMTIGAASILNARSMGSPLTNPAALAARTPRP